jgi:predicted phage terminase large subunit-like protein
MRLLGDQASDSLIEPAVAAAELLRRRRARRSLVDYAGAIDVPGAPVDDAEEDPTALQERSDAMPAHVRLILERIEFNVRKRMGRLIIMAPPGSAKSSYVSVVTPAWAMQLQPEYRVILASYAMDLAVKQSRRTRSLVKQKKHTSIFPQGGLGGDQKAAHEWKLQNGSEFMAAGFMSGITGNRADLLLVDDPIKNREEADSVTVRQKVSDEFRESAKTRLKPDGSIIIIMTRWQEDDLVGEILPEKWAGESGMIQGRDGAEWEVICIPAKMEPGMPPDPLGRQPGQYLWTEWFPPEHWQMFENDPRGARTWSALFQQRPRPEEGLHFKWADARWYDPDAKPGTLPVIGTPGFGTEQAPWGPPAVVRHYGGSDYATLDDRGDFSEHGLFGLTPTVHLVAEDWWSGQKETDVSISQWTQMVARWKKAKNSAFPVIRWWNEGGPIDKAIKPAINRAMREYPGGEAFVTCEVLPSIQSKETKLLSFHALYSANTVVFPIRREWARQVVGQLVAFPAGKYDDKADVCGLVGRGIDKMGVTAVPSPAEKRKELIPFSAAWLESGEAEPPTVRFW